MRNEHCVACFKYIPVSLRDNGRICCDCDSIMGLYRVKAQRFVCLACKRAKRYKIIAYPCLHTLCPVCYIKNKKKGIQKCQECQESSYICTII